MCRDRPLSQDSLEKWFSDVRGHERVLPRRRPCPEGSCAERARKPPSASACQDGQ